MDREDMAKYPGLVRRRNVWYLRMRVPKDLVPSFGRAEISKSLRTEDRREAIELYRHAQAALQARFDQARAFGGGGFERLSPYQLEGMAATWLDAQIAQLDCSEGKSTEALADIDETLERLRSPDPLLHSPHAIAAANALLASAGIPLRRPKIGRAGPAIDLQGSNYAMLLGLVRRGLIHISEAKRAHAVGATPPSISLTSSSQSAEGSTSRHPGEPEQTVADLIAAYRHSRSAAFGEASTSKRYEYVFRALEIVVGPDMPVSRIKRRDCEAIQAFLARLPSNASKIYPKLSAEEAIAAGERDGKPRLAPNTVGTYIEGLKAVLNWALEDDWITRNPAAKLRVRGQALVKRRRFEPSELHTIFEALAPLRTKSPAKFWIPAMALYSGARLGEICQLHVSNVVIVDGVHCIDFTEYDAVGKRVSGKTLKTEASERIAPLHDKLIAAGFLTYLSRRSERGGELLFPEIKPAKNGSHSHETSKWFGRLKRKVGLGQPSLVFHSFRHGFRDACRLANIPDETAKALAGWADDTQASKYGDRAMVPVLNRAVQTLTFGDFDLTHYARS